MAAMKLAAALAGALLLILPARAGCPDGCGREAPSVSTSWSGDAKAPLRLILASPSHGYGGPLWIAIEMDVADGWFVYASTTDAAAGPALEWNGSANLGPPVLRWPTPQTVTLDGKPTPVYRGRVVLPISVSPLQPDQDIELGLTVSYAVCGEVCRPGYAVHRIRISAAPLPVPAAAARHAAVIADALAIAPP